MVAFGEEKFFHFPSFPAQFATPSIRFGVPNASGRQQSTPFSALAAWFSALNAVGRQQSVPFITLAAWFGALNTVCRQQSAPFIALAAWFSALNAFGRQPNCEEMEGFFFPMQPAFNLYLHILKSRKMKQYFLPGGDPKKLLWIINFGKKLPAYKEKYGITSAEIEDIQRGSTFFSFLLSFITVFTDFFQKLTTYKNESRDGTKDGQPAGVLPPVPDPGSVPEVPQPGIFKRATSLANVIKKKANYTISDGEDLGIEGPEMEEADGVNDKPIISLLLVQGGHVQVKWTKKRFDGIDIYVDRGDGNWVFLATDTIPDYVDTHTLPDAGKSALWRYKAIYRISDQQAAQWSDVVSITVGTAL